MKSLFLTEKIGYPGKADTNLIIRESVKRFDTYAFEPHDLMLVDGIATVNAYKVSIDEKGEPQASEKKYKITLDNCVVTIRLNPPFDSRYLTAMYMLEHVGKKAYVNNNPKGINNMPEKFLPAELQRFAPPTLISQSEKDIMDFWKDHGEIILKPVYGFGGGSVFHLKKGDDNFRSIYDSMLSTAHEPIIAQKYLPEIKTGDKRVVLINGKHYTQFLRIPPEGQLQAAVGRGGAFVECELSTRDKEICDILGPILDKNDIYLCGFDMIGDHLTEINVTCPAVFYCYNELNKNKAGYVPSEKFYWDGLENKLKNLDIL